MAKKIRIQNLSEPLGFVKAAKVDIDPGDGNLIIDSMSGGEQLLVSGSLQYLENQAAPACLVNTSNGQATLTLQTNGKGQPWFRLPWSACNGATEWQVHLNPNVASDITAHTSGGNIKIDLAGMTVTSVMADTGGGNIDVVLPGSAANLQVSAKTGAGKVSIAIGSDTTGCSSLNAGSGAGDVVVRVPGSIAARIHASSGMGKVIVDQRFSQIEKNIYQSPGYERAANKVEITAKSGAGNVIIN